MHLGQSRHTRHSKWDLYTEILEMEDQIFRFNWKSENSEMGFRENTRSSENSQSTNRERERQRTCHLEKTVSCLVRL